MLGDVFFCFWWQRCGVHTACGKRTCKTIFLTLSRKTKHVKNLYEVEYKNGKATAQDKCGNGSSEEKVIYTESILNGTDPVLNDNLVPVTIADNGVVSKADIYSE